jgi:hypothetical protein
MMQLLSLIQTVAPARIDARSLGPLAGIVYTDEFRLRNNDIALGYLLKRPAHYVVALSDQYELRSEDLPAVATMATVVQIGAPDLIFLALGKIGRWIEANGYRFAGPYREIGLQLPSGGTPEEMVIEVQVPIEPQHGPALPSSEMSLR